MAPRPILLACLLAASAPALSGCVAAAIPVVAGGLMATKGDLGDGEDEAKVEATAHVDVPVSATPQPAETATIETAVTTTSDELPAIVRDSDPIEEAPPGELAASFDKTMGVAPPTVPTEKVELAPARPVAPAAATREPLSMRAYDAFYSYVDAQSRRDPVEQPRDSALLSSPGLLRPDRTECSIRPPAIVIDLDPAEGRFDPSIPTTRNNALGQMLGAMRMQDIEIFWISSLPAVQAGAVRRALASSGLDTTGGDQLLLMRNGEDRKQERRREVSKTHCVVAIAGDTRADFDELYLYLKDRSAAQPLEELVGAGWFLTPLPIEEGL